MPDRHCYCAPGQASCGTCERCGLPGHTRHFPGPVPVTGAWCDRCYRIVGWRSRLLRLGLPLLAAAALVAAARACGG